MKRIAEQHTHRTIKGTVHCAFFSALILFVFNVPGYGAAETHVKVHSTPAAVEEAALLAGLGGESGLTSQGMFTEENGIIGTTAVPAFLAELQDEGETVYSETPLAIESMSGTMPSTLPLCKDSCSL